MEKKMDDVVTGPEEPVEETQVVVSRRSLLKTVAATGGAVAFGAFVPEKWTKPVVEAGKLSAHAAASPVNETRVITSGLWDEAGNTFEGEILCQAPAGVVSNDTASLSASTSPSGHIIFSDTLL